MTQKLTDDDVQAGASALGVDTATIRAVTDVESNGSGFLPDGRVVVQYEPHVMYKRVRQKFGEARAAAELKAHPDLLALRAGSYQGKDKEDRDMDRAAQLIDRDCALEAASWGMFQIMGYHWSTCGYPSLQAFLNDLYRSEGGQLRVFVRFVQADKRLLAALRKRDWAVFARLYNGPAYTANHYDTKLASAYARHS